MTERDDALPDEWVSMRDKLDHAKPAEEMTDEEVSTWAEQLKKRERLCSMDSTGPEEDHPGSLLYGYERNDGELLICRLGVGEEDCYIEYDGPCIQWEAGKASEAMR